MRNVLVCSLDLITGYNKHRGKVFCKQECMLSLRSETFSCFQILVSECPRPLDICGASAKCYLQLKDHDHRHLLQLDRYEILNHDYKLRICEVPFCQCWRSTDINHGSILVLRFLDDNCRADSLWLHCH